MHLPSDSVLQYGHSEPALSLTSHLNGNTWLPAWSPQSDDHIGLGVARTLQAVLDRWLPLFREPVQLVEHDDPHLLGLGPRLDGGSGCLHPRPSLSTGLTPA